MGGREHAAAQGKYQNHHLPTSTSTSISPVSIRTAGPLELHADAAAAGSAVARPRSVPALFASAILPFRSAAQGLDERRRCCRHAEEILSFRELRHPLADKVRDRRARATKQHRFDSAPQVMLVVEFRLEGAETEKSYSGNDAGDCEQPCEAQEGKSRKGGAKAEKKGGGEGRERKWHWNGAAATRMSRPPPLKASPGRLRSPLRSHLTLGSSRPDKSCLRG